MHSKLTEQDNAMNATYLSQAFRCKHCGERFKVKLTESY
jgi:transposase-like protein